MKLIINFNEEKKMERTVKISIEEYDHLREAMKAMAFKNMWSYPTKYYMQVEDFINEIEDLIEKNTKLAHELHVVTYNKNKKWYEPKLKH